MITIENSSTGHEFSFFQNFALRKGNGGSVLKGVTLAETVRER